MNIESSVMYFLVRKLLYGTPIQNTKLFEVVYKCYVMFIQRKLPQEQREVIVPFRGLSFAIDKGDITMLPTLLKGTYETCELNLLADSLAVNTTFIDVGANIGIYTVLAAVSPNVERVISFEPNSRIAEICRRNIGRLEKTASEKCEVVEAALSSTHGRAGFAFTGYHGTGHLVSKTSERFDVSVPTTTLDIFMDSRPVSKNIFIKVDVEGFEPDVILGAKRLIAEFRPSLLVEVCGRNSVDVSVSWDNAILLLAETYKHMNVISNKGSWIAQPTDIHDRLHSIVSDGRLHNVFLF